MSPLIVVTVLEATVTLPAVEPMPPSTVVDASTLVTSMSPVVAFMALVEPLGFTLAAALMLGGLMLFLGVRPLPAIGLAVTTAAACFGIFGMLMRVTLPRGPFGW